MSKLLKLTGTQTYIGPLTRTGVGEECAKVTKGQVIRMDDKEAASACTGQNVDREGRPVPYFTDVTDTFDGEPDWDFSKKVEVKKVAKPDVDGGDGDDNGTDETASKSASTPAAAPRTQRVAAKKS